MGSVAGKTWRRYIEAAGALWMSFPMALGVVAVCIYRARATHSPHATCSCTCTTHAHARTMCTVHVPCTHHVHAPCTHHARIIHTPHARLASQVLCRMATSGWLAWWCSEEGAISRNLGAFVGGYLLWVIATLFVSVGRDCTFAYAELRAASVLHNAMLAAVMHAPMSFFDTTPLGRIVARFSKDQDTLDKKLPESFNSLVACLLDVTSTLPAATACARLQPHAPRLQPHAPRLQPHEPRL